MNDPYDIMVRYYDAENAGFTEDFAAYELLAERFGGPVLDVGCGTGRVAFALARKGVRVVGVDLSQAMLDRAKERAAMQGFDAELLEWHQGDMRVLTLDERFNLGLFTYHTFMHFLEQKDQIAVLKRAAGHLTENGALVFDLPNPVEMFRADDEPGLVLERTFTDPETGHPVMQQSVALFDRAEQLLDVTWVYDRVAPDGQVTRTLVPLELRYTLAAEMRLLLAAVGLNSVEIYGDYEFGPYDDNSPRMFVVAARRGFAE